MLKFLKDFLIYGFASVIGKMAAVFLMPVYTAVLTKEEYGALALVTSAKGIIDLVSNLNIHSGIARDYYEANVNRTKLISTGLYSILVLSCLVCSVMLMSQAFWQQRLLELGDKYTSAFFVMLLTIPAGSLLSYFSILTRFKKKPLLYSVGTLIQLLIQIGVSVYGVVILKAGIVSIFVGMLIGEMFAIAFFYAVHKDNVKFSFSFHYLRKALLFALPTLPAILAGWVDSSAGQMVIGKYISKVALGEYSIALQLASVFTLINIALHNVWNPFLYENYTKNDFQRIITVLFKMVVYFLSSICVCLSLLSKEIVLILSNASYIKATEYLTLLCLPMCIYLLFPIATSGISISRDTKHIGFAYICGSVVNVVFIGLLVPYLAVYAIPLCLFFSRAVAYVILSQVTRAKGILSLPYSPLFILLLAVLLSYSLLKLDLQLCYRLLFLLVATLILILQIVRIYRDNKLILREF